MAKLNLGRIGMAVKGEWNSSFTYQRLDVVSYQGGGYVAITDTPSNILPTNTAYWLQIAAPADKTDVDLHKADILKHKQAAGITQTGVLANAEGYMTKASGKHSHAEGDTTEASGDYSHAEGTRTVASNYDCHAEGAWTVASGEDAHAEGLETTADGNCAHAEGYGSHASGESSHAEGCDTIASGYYSHAQGEVTNANNYASHAMGRYNKTLSGNQTSFLGTADALVIGNGTGSSAKSNAFRVTFDGKTYGLSAFNSTGADYAEFFEWLDGNADNEDRVGYFVTLDGDKLRKATYADDYILGIISAQPSVVGDNYADDWNGKYVTDAFGRVQYQEVLVPASYRTIHHRAKYDRDDVILVDAYDEQVLETAERIDIVPVINPDWDSEQEYIPREKRKEWSAVGIMGKLLVRDDGTCQVNGYCRPDDNGMATASQDGYRVMKRISDGIIQVFLK